MRTEALFAWITERHAIYEAKNAGYPKPWTEDPILQAYRFCNVYRELDKVTRWIAEHWRDTHYDSPEVWFAMTVARLVNWPDTLEELGYPVPFDPMHFIEVLERRKQAKEKVFTGVYIVPAKAGFASKARYIASEVLNPMWCQRNDITESAHSLADFHAQLTKYNGMGSFLAGQVVCDTKYTKLLVNSVDWADWACSGPGSKRGLNRVMNYPVDQVGRSRCGWTPCSICGDRSNLWSPTWVCRKSTCRTSRIVFVNSINTSGYGWGRVSHATVIRANPRGTSERTAVRQEA